MARSGLLHHLGVFGRHDTVDIERRDRSTPPRPVSCGSTFVVWFLLCAVRSGGQIDHGSVLARYPDIHWIDGNNAMHSRYLAKLPGHTKPHTGVGGHHLPAAHLALLVLEHPVAIPPYSAAQAQDLLLVQSDRRDHRIDSHRRIHDQRSGRNRRHLGPRIPSPRRSEIVVDHVQYDGNHGQLGNDGHQCRRFHALLEEAEWRLLAGILLADHLFATRSVWHHFYFFGKGRLREVHLGPD